MHEELSFTLSFSHGLLALILLTSLVRSLVPDEGHWSVEGQCNVLSVTKWLLVEPVVPGLLLTSLKARSLVSNFNFFAVAFKL